MKSLNYVILILLFSGQIFAQQVTITGTVTDGSSLPLPGVNIVVKGTTTATQTDFDGKYNLSAKVGDILIFSYVGFTSKNIIVQQGNYILDVQLEEDAAQLEEVVVTAYGTNRKQSILGYAVTNRFPKKESKNAKLRSRLQNRAAQQIQQTTPNQNIKIRGVASITGTKQPLYVVDGVPIEAKNITLIQGLNPDKIAKVTTYRSADAKSIFGAQARHGCIVITTKAGNYRVENDESYTEIVENEFENVRSAPLSTFSLDVDKASYSNVRRMINNGETIPADAVKIEEMVNYFNYEYAQPTDEHPFAIHTEFDTTPWNQTTKLVKIGIKGKEIAKQDFPASNLVFLIDVSGSMESPNKLPLLKQAFKLLVNQLREKDKVSIVVYAGAAGMVLKPTSGEHKEKIMQAINNLSAGGSTAGGAGIELAYSLAVKNFVKNGNNRVILATDGDFNVGANSDKDMEKLIEEKRKSGVFLTCLGFGMGNYKDSKLETLADKGNGNHAYIDTLQEAKKVLGTEFGGTLYTIAKDVKIQVEFNPQKVKAYRLVGYENRLLDDEDFVDDTKDAGELGSGHTVTAFYEIIPVGVESEFYKDVPDLKYAEMSAKGNMEDLLTVKFRYKKPKENSSIEMVHVLKDEQMKVSSDFNFAASVAWFGMKLRKSTFLKDDTTENIIALAKENRGDDTSGYKAEFIRLLQIYQGL